MIVVVEGISASGKTRWCAHHANGHIVPETGRCHDAPDSAIDPAGAAHFWVARNTERWQAALALERAATFAVCDSDPLKLHYIWTMWQTGAAAERDWQWQLAATRAAIAEGRLGFADRYLVANVTSEIARERARDDATRRRRNFEQHVQLQPALLAWYAALDAVLPGLVEFHLPATMPPAACRDARYDLATFDRLIAKLPQAPAFVTRSV